MSPWPFKRGKSLSTPSAFPLEVDLGEEMPYRPQSRTPPLIILPTSVTKQEHRLPLSKSRRGECNGWASVKYAQEFSSGVCLKVLGDAPVKAKVELMLEEPISVEAIALSIQGRLVDKRHPSTPRIFMDQSSMVWSRDLGDPRLSSCVSSFQSSSQRSQHSTRSRRHDGKLFGAYTWSYERSIPSCANHPPSFDEEGVYVKVEYCLVLTLEQCAGGPGSLARNSSRMEIPINYTPQTHTLSKQHGFHANPVVVASPRESPSRWRALPELRISGAILERQVELRTSLFMAESVPYTAGTFIPCYLTVNASDRLALDIVANSTTPVVKLLRKVSYRKDPCSSKSQPGIGAPWADVIDEIGQMTWRPQPLEQTRTRDFYGELQLPLELQPSWSSPMFSISYVLQYLTFNCPAFYQSYPSTPYLSVASVEITTPRGGAKPSSIAVRRPKTETARRVRDQQGTPKDFSQFYF
ncbi:hypothetical protein FA15DRAFT_523561 [Coprinopsis marcescibilis]|uniref:Arrestin-like N-terminal domain-containing protein n=1 Tax=Coprinopsis marcescibilis TaxID=230819 RepID=A0A5C3KPT0_COPMA|nr:hypothetical protein FA15DRAFT_523561 [Coprinopsis marcescibilis]